LHHSRCRHHCDAQILKGVFSSRYGTYTGAAIFQAILFIASNFCGTFCVTSNSRMLFAFARDHGVLGSHWWKQVRHAWAWMHPLGQQRRSMLHAPLAVRRHAPVPSPLCHRHLLPLAKQGASHTIHESASPSAVASARSTPTPAPL
jgi:hypothetical protein